MAGFIAAGLADAVGISDIIAEAGELYEEFGAASEANFIGPLEQTPAGVAEYVQGTLGIGGAVGMQPGLTEVVKRLRFESDSSHGSSKRRRIGPPSSERSFSNMAKAPRRTPARRKRSIYRSRPRMTRRRINTGAAVGVGMSTLARASIHRGKNVVLKKMAAAPTPTEREAGAAITSVLENSNGKTTPNGVYSFGYHFELSQFPNYASYTALYQWYKILWVKLHFYPLQASYPAIVQSNSTNPILGIRKDGSGQRVTEASRLVIAPDHQSDALFTNEAEAMEHDGAVHHCFNDGNEFSTYLSPKPTGLVGSAGSEVVYLTPENKWITTSSATVPHYGLRCFMTQPDGSSIKVIMEMKVAFRGNKT